jgi:hypothetical protein
MLVSTPFTSCLTVQFEASTRERGVDEPRQEGPGFPLLKMAFRSWIFDRPGWQSLPKLSPFDGRLSPPATAQLPEHYPDAIEKAQVIN